MTDDTDHIDGHSLESLSDYLDRGREPRDLTIESSPAAQHALAALSRLRAVAPRVVAAEAEFFAPKNENWITRILDQIGVQAHAGRDIPIPYDVDGAHLWISEGAVRALIREAGDCTAGLMVERVRLDGDIDELGAPVSIEVVVSTFENFDEYVVATEFERRVRESLGLHTDLVIVGFTVRVHESDLSEEKQS